MAGDTKAALLERVRAAARAGADVPAGWSRLDKAGLGALLARLGRRGARAPVIVVYGYDYCPYTRQARDLAAPHQPRERALRGIVPASAIRECAPSDTALWGRRREVEARAHRTIPMCFDLSLPPGSQFIGGKTELEAYLRRAARA